MGLRQGSGSALAVLVTASVALLLMVGSARATEHTVGDSAGWAIPANVNYTVWSSANTFHVGDTLLFKYSTSHNVEEVTEANYNDCIAASPLSSHTDGNTTIGLTTLGMHYFICGITGHCQVGQKISVNVVNSTSTSTSSSTSNSTGSSSGVSLSDFNLIFRPSSPLLGIGFFFTLLSLIF